MSFRKSHGRGSQQPGPPHAAYAAGHAAEGASTGELNAEPWAVYRIKLEGHVRLKQGSTPHGAWLNDVTSMFLNSPTQRARMLADLAQRFGTRVRSAQYTVTPPSVVQHHLLEFACHLPSIVVKKHMNRVYLRLAASSQPPSQPLGAAPGQATSQTPSQPSAGSITLPHARPTIATARPVIASSQSSSAMGAPASAAAVNPVSYPGLQQAQSTRPMYTLDLSPNASLPRENVPSGSSTHRSLADLTLTDSSSSLKVVEFSSLPQASPTPLADHAVLTAVAYPYSANPAAASQQGSYTGTSAPLLSHAQTSAGTLSSALAQYAFGASASAAPAAPAALPSLGGSVQHASAASMPVSFTGYGTNPQQPAPTSAPTPFAGYGANPQQPAPTNAPTPFAGYGVSAQQPLPSGGLPPLTGYGASLQQAAAASAPTSFTGYGASLQPPLPSGAPTSFPGYGASLQPPLPSGAPTSFTGYGASLQQPLPSSATAQFPGFGAALAAAMAMHTPSTNASTLASASGAVPGGPGATLSSFYPVSVSADMFKVTSFVAPVQPASAHAPAAEAAATPLATAVRLGQTVAPLATQQAPAWPTSTPTSSMSPASVAPAPASSVSFASLVPTQASALGPIASAQAPKESPANASISSDVQQSASAIAKPTGAQLAACHNALYGIVSQSPGQRALMAKLFPMLYERFPWLENHIDGLLPGPRTPTGLIREKKLLLFALKDTALCVPSTGYLGLKRPSGNPTANGAARPAATNAARVQAAGPASQAPPMEASIPQALGATRLDAGPATMEEMQAATAGRVVPGYGALVALHDDEYDDVVVEHDDSNDLQSQASTLYGADNLSREVRAVAGAGSTDTFTQPASDRSAMFENGNAFQHGTISDAVPSTAGSHSAARAPLLGLAAYDPIVTSKAPLLGTAASEQHGPIANAKAPLLGPTADEPADDSLDVADFGAPGTSETLFAAHADVSAAPSPAPMNAPLVAAVTSINGGPATSALPDAAITSLSDGSGAGSALPQPAGPALDSSASEDSMFAQTAAEAGSQVNSSAYPPGLPAGLSAGPCVEQLGSHAAQQIAKQTPGQAAEQQSQATERAVLQTPPWQAADQAPRQAPRAQRQSAHVPPRPSAQPTSARPSTAAKTPAEEAAAAVRRHFLGFSSGSATLADQGCVLGDYAAAQQFRDRALLGTLDLPGVDDPDEREIYINTNEPFVIAAVGVQGGGKSHTLACILESCLVPFEPGGLVRLRAPMCGLVLHYDQSDASVCEATGLIQLHPNVPRLLKEIAGGLSGLPPAVSALPEDKMIVLVSSAYYLQRTAFYGTYCKTRCLLFHWDELSADHIKRIMRIDGKSTQLYMATLLDLLREHQRADSKPTFQAFVAQVRQRCDIKGQDGPLTQRLRLLESIVFESDINASLREHALNLRECMRPGVLIVADMTDPMLAADEANGIFQVLTEQFRTTPVPGSEQTGKILALDEAHKYMHGAAGDGLSEAIVNIARLMRHDGIRLLVSTQSPAALAPELLELVTVAVLHRFHSRDWYTYLEKKIPLGPGHWETVMALRPGHALVFASHHRIAALASGPESQGIDSDHAESSSGPTVTPTARVLPVFIRPRITADRGSTRKNR
eukprot:m.158863 g.158863  ORF g.158863 m.158863 type:complete len:1621 (+) comp9832_c0_seq2:2-4864(+)